MSEILDREVIRIQEEENDYANLFSESQKQEYWDKRFCSNWWRCESNIFPIKLSEFRENNRDLEPNFDTFIPWIMSALEELGFTWSIESIFILDEQAKKHLEICGHLTSNSKKVGGIID